MNNEQSKFERVMEFAFAAWALVAGIALAAIPFFVAFA